VIDLICGNQDEISAAIFVTLLCFEYWIGRTDSVKANSTLELIINVLKALIKKG
jgi:hypothetical protein